MTRPLPSAALSVNLLRELADGIERETSGEAREAVRTKPDEPENLAKQVAPKIAGDAFQVRLRQWRQQPDERERTKQEKAAAPNHRKNPGRR